MVSVYRLYMTLFSRFANWQLNRLDRLIPNINLLPNDDLRRARLFIGILFYVLLLNMIMLAVRLENEGWSVSTLSTSRGSLVFILLLSFYRITGKLNLLTDVAVILALLNLSNTIYNDGGLISRGTLWLPVFPLVAQTIAHKIKAKTALALTWACLIFLFHAHYHKYIHSTEPMGLLFARGMTMSMVILFVAIITLIYDHSRRLLNEQLIAEKENAEQAFKQKSEFLATMSHELRTPFNGVLGMLELLTNSSLTDQQQHRVGLAKSSAKSLLFLINDILDYSKIEAGKQYIESIEFDLQTLFGSIVKAMALQASSKNIELILDSHLLLSHSFKGDPNRIRQVTTNLISNAIKFTNKGNIIISLESKTDKQISLLTVAIKDSGIGIPINKLNILFDSFTQVDASTSRKFGGSGLGLAIAKNLCHLMGGDISVNSTEGVGSTFTFTVKVENLKQDNALSTLPSIENKHIMIIDNNERVLESIDNQLKDKNAHISLYTDSEAAIDYLHNNKDIHVDLIMVNSNPPKQSGLILTREMKQILHLKNTKFVLMTDINTINVEQDLADSGVVFSVPKPITFDDLKKSLTLIPTDIVQAKLGTTETPEEYHEPSLDKSVKTVDTRSQLNILVIDDSAINLEVAAALLDSFDIQPVLASSAEHAFIILASHPKIDFIDGILMDCQMPDMDGFQATQAIRSGRAGVAYQSIPIIALTANSMVGDKEKCLAAGMNDYLSKPIDISRLLAVIDANIKHPIDNN
jgi:two-component system sensor histidine kinase/response regulator